MLLIERVHGSDLSGLNAVVVGRSNIVGKPMANLLPGGQRHGHHRPQPHQGSRRRVRSGRYSHRGRRAPEMLKGDWIKPGATVVDVGINRIPAPEKGEGKTRLVGDVAFAEASEKAGAITPVPGGVGPMTIAMLMANTLVSGLPLGRARNAEVLSR